MAKKAKFLAAPTEGGYNLVLIAANGDVLFNDRQGRPKANLRRDLARIKRATATADLVIDEANQGSEMANDDPDQVNEGSIGKGES